MNAVTGEWRVMRDCCRSGNCVKCHGVTPVGTPIRIVQGDRYSEAYAKHVALNWARYKATVEKMGAFKRALAPSTASE